MDSQAQLTNNVSHSNDLGKYLRVSCNVSTQLWVLLYIKIENNTNWSQNEMTYRRIACELGRLK